MGKRFSTAELLAQYWYCGDMGSSPLFRDVLWRFAAEPHYDEKETDG